MGLRVDALTDTTGGSPLMLELDSIDEDPDQPRFEFDPESLVELAQTIRARGVRQPISVRPHADEPGRWVLNFGARRLRASRLAGLAEIPAFVDSGFDTYDQVIENEQREGLRPIELARFVKARMEEGDSQAEVARSLGKSESYVTHVRALVDAPDWLMDVYRRGQCTGMLELYQLRALHARSPAHVEQLIAGVPNISRSELATLKAKLNAESAPDPASERGAKRIFDDHARPSTRTRTADTAALPSNGGPTRGPSAALRTNGLALFAQRDGKRVEVLVDAIPDEQGHIFVRTRTGGLRESCDARRVRLLGFLARDES